MAACVNSLSEYPVFFSSAGSSAHLLSGFWYRSLIWPARVTQRSAALFAGWKGPIGRRRNGEYAQRPFSLAAWWKA